MRLRDWIAAVALLSTGCSLRMGDLTAVATMNVRVPSAPLHRTVEGKDCVDWLFMIIPLGSIVPNVQEAMDRALAKVPEGNALTNVRLYNDPLVIPYLWLRNCLRINGEVVQVTEGGQR
ncbi:MAG: hypothetical protein HY271_04615 [Deltaproteobacteria bacterium]|nr:hypothetical protein [Deltaproteobacteria bacterium]